MTVESTSHFAPASHDETERYNETLTSASDNIYDDGHLRVEHDNYYVACDGRAVQLPRKEFLILSRLARNPQRIVLAEEIWQHAWGKRAPFNAESLHVHIYRLRRRFEARDLHIETMVGVGYRMLTDRREQGRPEDER